MLEQSSQFAAALKEYRLTMIVGDRYGGEFVREPFQASRSRLPVNRCVG
jgi:hypothetical protein